MKFLRAWVLGLVACSAGSSGSPDASATDASIDASSDSAEDAGSITDASTPSAHPAEPTIVDAGGAVVASPKVLPILLSGDPDSADVTKLFAELAASSAWATETSEYGVGKLTVLAPVTFDPGASPISDQTLRSTVQANTYGASPAWGQADPSTIYFFVIPPGTTVTNSALAPSCTSFDGYHSDVTSGSATVAYAVAAACDGYYGKKITALEQRTIAIVRQLVDAVTNPFPDVKPAWFQTDPNDILWSWVTGGEAGDMCLEFGPGFMVPSDMSYMLLPAWSNAAAAKGENPCVPANLSEPFFDSVPVLSDTVKLAGSFVTKGVQIPLGTSKSVPVELYSVAPTSGPWTISAIDYETLIGNAPILTLSLDKNSGMNGDEVNLTITPNKADDNLKGEAFLLLSTRGGQTSVSMGFVGN